MNINKDYIVGKKQVFRCRLPKTQIMLAHTSSTIDDYFIKITKRHYGEYQSVFTYTIGLDGVVYQHYDPDDYTVHFGITDIDNQIISIGLENVGWLKQKSSGQFIDWKGNIYKGEVLEKMWRGYNFWAKYSEEQIISMIELANALLKEYKIDAKFSGKNLPLENAVEFEGVLNRSNYYKFYYDLSPAMDFERITLNIK